MTRPTRDEIVGDLDELLNQVARIGGMPDVESRLRAALGRLRTGEDRPTVAVVGASTDRAKFGNKAVRAYRDAGFEVFPIHPIAPEVEGLTAYRTLDDLPVDRLDRVSLYVPAAIGLQVLPQLARKDVAEVWLNPGADAPEVVALARELGLNVVQACSILAVGGDPGRP